MDPSALHDVIYILHHWSSVKFFSVSEKYAEDGLNGTQEVVSGPLTDVTDTPWIYIPNKSRHFYYISLLDEWDVTERLLLNLGARYDDYSDFGSTTNPRLSLSYQFTDTLTFKLFSGSAFRAPSFAELYSQNNPVGLGNPALGPEGVNTFESGLNVEFFISDNFQVTFSLFDYSADDLINYVFVPEKNGNQAQNQGEQNGRGGELDVRWKPQKNISVNFHYNTLDVENSQGQDIHDIPNQMFYLDMHWRINEQFQWFINSKWVKDRKRRISDWRAPIKDYNLVNTQLSFSGLTTGLTLSLSIKNLFDTDAREPSTTSIPGDYPLPGRQWMLTLNYRY